MSARLYTLFLAAVGLGRLIELRISRRHQRALAMRGIVKIPEPHFADPTYRAVMEPKPRFVPRMVKR
jgi:hypothetical protein